MGAGYVPWRSQQSVAGQGDEQSVAGPGNKQSVAGQGDKGAVARAALAAPTKEDAETFADPRAHLQGRGGARSLEAGHHRPFPAPQDLSDLPVVGRSRAEIV